MRPDQIDALVREQSPFVFNRMFGAMDKVREDYSVASPTMDHSRDIDGKQFVELLGLLKMKLVSFRDKDRVHVRDMMGVGLIDESWLEKLTPALADRLQELLDDPDG